MNRPKYQIFVSSTFEDLRLEREQVIKAILEMGHIPVGMEMFSAGDEQQWEIIRKQIEESDYYLVILAHRYGSMDGELSYTEKEYLYALDQNVPALGFVLNPDVDWPDQHRENNKNIISRLNAFRSRVCSKMVSFWNNSDDLYGKASIFLMKAFTSHPRVGWIRNDEGSSREMIQELTRLSKENGMLRTRVKELEADDSSSEDKAVNRVIDALRENKRSVFVWKNGAADWGDAISTTLLRLFEIMSHDLLDEASNETLSRTIAFEAIDSDEYRRSSPVPSNYVKEWIADL